MPPSSNSVSAGPASYGITFTPTIHTKAEGPTLPESNPLRSPFVAVVTGAGKGLGRVISMDYVRAGVSGIAIAARTATDLESLEAELKKANPSVKVLVKTCDTTKEEDVKALADAVKAEFGRLDVVVANAGVISNYLIDSDGKRQLPVGVMEDDDFKRVIDINLMGSVYTAKHFVPLLADTKDGPQAFVQITSLASHSIASAATPIAYNVSKIAVNRLVEHIHNDHNARLGVCAYSIHPGAVVTAQTELHSNDKGDMWDQILTDDIGLVGGFLTWLTKEKRDWLSGRYVSVNWDVEQLESMREEIVKEDKLKFRMAV
ncbi:NAD(P)-binding protein [Eremomyces bilateralis CBS 781.70]|uniref:NAD(P)-binding protein n=1 Tax=Eremomyces bilateralis CBS 781.70 TaxID=1392243 RepID=A0A6G1FU22_9PEZI|nr:NAD(P)-binding protein [Eremomyces bilateralis CBS 781.70]KAF1809297.1 NAD(P)-binding protein [Eremomyces bilateralis CBS 781.70]